MLPSLPSITCLRVLSLCLYLFLCWLSPPSEASNFQQGIEAVKQQNYSLAIEHFQRGLAHDALTTDQRSVVYFNLGVCYYRIAMYDKAVHSFKEAMSSHLLLWRSVFNLALVAEKQQRWRYAGKLYKKTIDNSNDNQLLNLAQQKLDQLLLSNQLTLADINQKFDIYIPTQWRAVLSSAAGHDSELVDPKDFSGSGSEDRFYEIFAAAYRPLLVAGNRYWVFSTLAYAQRYESIEEFDMTLLSAGLEHRWQFDEHLLRAGVIIERSVVGGDDYLLTQIYNLSYRWPSSSGAKIDLKYAYRNYDALSERYNPLDGFSQELELSWTEPWVGYQRLQAGLFLLTDERDDHFDLLWGFTSFSAYRQGLRGAWDYRRWGGRYTVDVEFRNSLYHDHNTMADWTEKRRRDRRYKIGINANYLLSSALEFNLEYHYTYNKSNLTNYSYQGGIATIGLSYEY